MSTSVGDFFCAVILAIRCAVEMPLGCVTRFRGGCNVFSSLAHATRAHDHDGGGGADDDDEDDGDDDDDT